MIETGITQEARLLWLKSILNDTCRLALYTQEAELGPMTRTYTEEGEVKGQGYTAGGLKLKGCCVEPDEASGGAFITWESPVWPKASITAAGYMIYDTSKNNTTLFVGAWGSNYTSTNGPFTVNLPPNHIGLV